MIIEFEVKKSGPILEAASELLQSLKRDQIPRGSYCLQLNHWKNGKRYLCIKFSNVNAAMLARLVAQT